MPGVLVSVVEELLSAASPRQQRSSVVLQTKRPRYALLERSSKRSLPQGPCLSQRYAEGS